MPYSAADERFSHQYSRPFDEVHLPDGSWSDRCYFFAHSPDGDLLVTNGYGNNPNQRRAHGYGKVARADGRPLGPIRCTGCVGADRDDLQAGPMRWTCVEPLKHWHLELPANGSGVAWDMHYEPRAPMWELLPMSLELDGRTILDMYHMKESGIWRGWVDIDGERVSVDGWPGGRDRTFGVRVADEIDWWIWLDIGFADRAIQAWVIEAHDGTVHYVDGGVTTPTAPFRSGSSASSIGSSSTATASGRPASARLHRRGRRHAAGDRHGAASGRRRLLRPPDEGFTLNRWATVRCSCAAWDSSDPEVLATVESQSMSIDQLMRFETDGMVGHGIFEILSGGAGHGRYPNWPVMDMSKFRQHAAE
ncbi:MAG: hypothetical protein R2695_00445 [Acidimicrobiales bacterium]